jgi:hypothetical protein
VRLEEALPEYDFRERHSRWIEAPPERVDEAVRAVTIGDMPIARILFRIRLAPARLLGRAWKRRPLEVSLIDHALDVSFGSLGDEAADEIALGLIGQPWKIATGDTRRFHRPQDFVAFSEPGFVKAAMNFRFERRGSGTLLTTETRVLATDPKSRGRFRRYWFVIRPGSGLIRRSWLRAAERRAIVAQPGSPSK